MDGLRPVWTNSSQDPISKITGTKWTGGVAQGEKLLCKSEAVSSNLTKGKKNQTRHSSAHL
jgi:hypothetical protein